MDYEQNQEDQNSVSSNMEPSDLSADESSTKLNHILIKYSKSLNLVDEILKKEDGEIKIHRIAMKVYSGIQGDESTQREWKSRVEESQKLIKLIKEPKNYPLPQSASIKFPVITDACYQFQARTYPEIIQDNKVVKFETVGEDVSGMLAEIANVASNHMNYQLVGPDNEWEASIDKTLVSLAAIGFLLRKTYFDRVKKKNVSELCNYKDIILRNSEDIQCLYDLRRITHILHQHPNDLIENCRKGIYQEDICNEVMKMYADVITDPVCTLYEQHSYLDLDDDGYEEPYIITMHKESNKILRIVARYAEEDIELDGEEVVKINPIQYFTDFHFLPSPDGTFMSIGFGILMLHLQETINTILNQLIDAGSLANMQTGIIDSRVKLMGGQMGVDPGQWTRARGVMGQTLEQGFHQIQYKEPSNVLFQLLGLLIKSAQDLTSSTDVMQGAISGTNVPATTMMAMIEQGMKRFSAIQKRLYRSLKEEYRKLFKLNKLYTDPKEFSKIVGLPGVTPEDIYGNDNVRVFPVADPNLTTDAQRLSQAQVIMSLAQQPDSLLNKYEAQKRMLEAAKVTNISALLPPDAKNQQQKPDPKMIELQMKAQNNQAQTQIKSRHQDLKEKEFAAKLAKMEAEITQLQANAVKLVSQASRDQHGMKMDEHSASLDTIKTKLDMMMQSHQQLVDSSVQQKELQLKEQDQQNQHQQVMTGHALTANQQNLDQQSLDQQEVKPDGQDNSQPSNNVD